MTRKDYPWIIRRPYRRRLLPPPKPTTQVTARCPACGWEGLGRRKKCAACCRALEPHDVA